MGQLSARKGDLDRPCSDLRPCASPFSLEEDAAEVLVLLLPIQLDRPMWANLTRLEAVAYEEVRRDLRCPRHFRQMTGHCELGFSDEAGVRGRWTTWEAGEKDRK